jgi:predicted permease
VTWLVSQSITMRDIAYGFRALYKTPLASLTIILTVALGLGMVASVFTLLNVFLFRVDEVPNVHELYGVERPRTAEGDMVPLTRPVYDALRQETSVFTDVFAMVAETDSRLEGRTLSGTLVTGNFFQVLGVGAARGRVLTSADDDDRNPVVVLSDRGWSSHFAGDPAVIGRSLLLNGIRYDVVGVMPKGFRGLAVGAPDYWAPLSLLPQLQPGLVGRNKEIEVGIIGRLRPGVSREVALAQLNAWDSRRDTGSAERRDPGIVLEPRRGTLPQPLEALAVFTPLFFAFGLILLIGCANVASLLLARGVSRQREIGVRLSLGASRAQIVRQLLSESLILSLAAAAVGYAISRGILETIVWAVMTTMPPDIGDVRLLVPQADWRVGVFLLGGAIVASVLFGLAPSLQATRIELVRIMRGEIVRDARPGRARNVLIGVQVTASALLLIAAAVFLRSALAASTIDLGFRTADTALVPIANESLRGQIVEALGRDPLIMAVAASVPDPVFGTRPALAESAEAKSPAAYRLVSPEYFSVLGIDVIRGRAFADGERSVDAAVAIVSDSFARQLWPTGNALGQVLRLAPDPTVAPREGAPAPLTGSFTIVGIARDVPLIPFAEGQQQANVYLPTTAATAGTVLTVRVHGEPETARQALLQRLLAIDPHMEQIVTFKTVAGMATYFLQIAFWLALVLGLLALVLTLSGLFSVLSYLVEQRTKEIGVRMALGATARDVGRLVLGQTFRPVAVGLAVGASLALATGIVVMTVAKPVGAIVHLLDPVAYVSGVLVIIIACGFAAWLPTMNAARIDPMKSLRHD